MNWHSSKAPSCQTGTTPFIRGKIGINFCTGAISTTEFHSSPVLNHSTWLWTPFTNSASCAEARHRSRIYFPLIWVVRAIRITIFVTTQPPLPMAVDLHGLAARSFEPGFYSISPSCAVASRVHKTLVTALWRLQMGLAGSHAGVHFLSRAARGGGMTHSQWSRYSDETNHRRRYCSCIFYTFVLSHFGCFSSFRASHPSILLVLWLRSNLATAARDVPSLLLSPF